jgi:hypothetical protein
MYCAKAPLDIKRIEDSILIRAVGPVGGITFGIVIVHGARQTKPGIEGFTHLQIVRIATRRTLTRVYM